MRPREPDKAFFIYDKFLASQDDGSNLGNGADQWLLLKPVNPGSSENGLDPVPALAQTIANIKKVQHWYRKLANWDLAFRTDEFTNARPEAFDQVLSNLRSAMRETLRATRFDPDQCHFPVQGLALRGAGRAAARAFSASRQRRSSSACSAGSVMGTITPVFKIPGATFRDFFFMAQYFPWRRQKAFLL